MQVTTVTTISLVSSRPVWTREDACEHAEEVAHPLSRKKVWRGGRRTPLGIGVRNVRYRFQAIG